MIIALVGRSGAGKSTISRELGKRLNLQVYEVGNFVKEMYKQSCSDISEGESVKFRRLEYVKNELEKNGDDFFLRQILDSVGDNIIISGVRSVAELNYLRSIKQKSIIVGLVCNEVELLKRFEDRESCEICSQKVIDDLFYKRRDLEVHNGVYSMINQCDIVIDTSKVSIEEAVRRILKVVN